MQNTIEDTTTTVSAAPEVGTEEELRELGLGGAADQMQADRALARKLRIAFEHHRIVKPEHITRFNEELKARTRKGEGTNQWGEVHTYDRLKETPLENYRSVPPKEALADLRKAKNLGCFDRFEVATVESVRVVPDPIIFGRITGSENRYFVTQWDDDISISQILKEDEG